MSVRVHKLRLVIIILALAVVAGAIHMLLLDGLVGNLFAVAMGEDTQYAPRYSDYAFRCLKEGMSSEEVLKLLGPPIDKSLNDGTETWRYSRSPSDNSYRLRSVLMRNGRVMEVFHEFYVD